MPSQSFQNSQTLGQLFEPLYISPLLCRWAAWQQCMHQNGFSPFWQSWATATFLSASHLPLLLLLQNKTSDPLDTNAPVSTAVSQARSNPYKSNLWFSSAAPSTSTSESRAVLQELLKNLILKEFKGATFLVDLTEEGGPFHVNFNTVQAILHCLQDYYHLTHATALYWVMTLLLWIACGFPPNGFKKKGQSYNCFIDFLNLVVCTMNICLPHTQSPQYLQKHL